MLQYNKNQKMNNNLKIDKQIIKKVDSCKYLGCIINTNFNFDLHI